MSWIETAGVEFAGMGHVMVQLGSGSESGEMSCLVQDWGRRDGQGTYVAELKVLSLTRSKMP